MNDEAKIVEASFFGGKLLVIFGDGQVALLEPGQIRQLAVESNSLTLLPTCLLRRSYPRSDRRYNYSQEREDLC